MKKLKTGILTLFITTVVFSAGFGQENMGTVETPCMPCEALQGLGFPELTIIEAEAVEEGAPHCRVIGIIGNEIKFELLLPAQWIARLLMKGNGAFAGGLQNSMAYVVNEGFATVVTNTGHESSPLKADWALNNMERQLNFGHLAVHRTTVVAKAIIKQYYQALPAYSYFIGCSRGGGEALIEAQRYPEDFDGIVAGAPAIDWPGFGANAIRAAQIMYPDPENHEEHLLSSEHLQLLREAVLKQCDEIDGLKDNILNEPTKCRFDFSALPVCPAEVGGKDCFTMAQINAIKLIYSEIRNEEGLIYPGFPFGEETDWQNFIVGPLSPALRDNFPELAQLPSLHLAVGTEMYKYLIFQDPDWDYSSYDFSTYFHDTEYAAAYLNATSTDYSSFKERGAKMILYQGWNDYAISAFATIDYYREVAKGDKEVDSYLRLFMLPGVLHCVGGTGPDKTDWLAAIINWVENGVAPERVLMSKKENGEVVMERPVFPYPAVSVYDGKGNPAKESSFVKKKEE